MKKSMYALLLIHIIVFAISCDTTDNEPTFQNGHDGVFKNTTQIITHDGCKTNYTRSIADEKVLLKAIGNNSLEIRHLDALLNCEPGNITLNCKVGEGLIFIKEVEASTAANCMCLYDLKYIVEIPTQGKYKLIINDRDFGEFQFNSSTEISLSKWLEPSL